MIQLLERLQFLINFVRYMGQNLCKILLSSLLSVSCLTASGQVNYVRIVIEKIFGVSAKTIERRSAERLAALPGIASADTLKDGSLSKYVWEPYNTVDAIESPEIAGRSLEADTRFLSDIFCSGRAMGTAGYSAAAFYVFRRFKECGLDVRVSSFRANGKTGHNIIGEHRIKYANKWIVVIARLDAVGDHSGLRFPGADANASGVAIMIKMAEKVMSNIMRRNIMFVALDGHHEGMSGATSLWNELNNKGIGKDKIAMVINLEELGSDLEPPVPGLKHYLIALGGDKYREKMIECNRGMMMNLHFDYYGSKNFTDLFYRRASDHKIFLEHGIPCVMFTSGITLNTNRPSDTSSSLNFPLMESRAEYIFRWMKTI